MAIIEGFGDEVVFLLFFLVAVIVLGIAWMSTRVDSSFFVHVIILDRERFSTLIQRIRTLAMRIPLAPVQQVEQSNGIQNVTFEPLSENPEVDGGNLQSTEVDGLLDTEGIMPDVVGNIPESVQPELDMTDSQNNHQTGIIPTETRKFTNSVASTKAEPEKSAEPSSLFKEATAKDSDGYLFAQSSDSSEAARVECETESSSTPEGQIAIRLQYVDGRQRTVHARPDETIGSFKRNNFSAELSNQSIVRFIMNGQELRNDDSTLTSCRVGQDSVIHCLISQVRNNPTPVSASNHQFDIGVLVFPLFGIMLTVLWYARIVYRGYFNGASTFSLVAISFLYVVSLIASFRNSGNAEHPHLHSE